MQSGRAALLVYHDSTAGGAQSPTGWAYAAVRTAKRLVGVLDTVLVTNRAKEPALTAGPFTRVVQLDVLAAAKIKPVAQRTLCGLKIFALLHGWEHGLLPEQVRAYTRASVHAFVRTLTGAPGALVRTLEQRCMRCIRACTDACIGACTGACPGALVPWSCGLAPAQALTQAGASARPRRGRAAATAAAELLRAAQPL